MLTQKPPALFFNHTHPLLKVYTLGRFAVYRGEQLMDDADWQRQKAKKMFKLLLMARQRQLPGEQVMEALWPDKTQSAARNNFHRTLFVLRRALQPTLTGGNTSDYIKYDGELLRLQPDVVAWVDIEAFQQLVSRAREARHDLAHYRAALELYTGDFMPDDAYDDWATHWRAKFQHVYADVLRQVVALHFERNESLPAIEGLEALLRIEPDNEGTLRDLMRLYSQTGQRYKALQRYQQLRHFLHTELGLEPATQTTAVYESLLTGTPSTDNTSAAVASPTDDEAHRVPLIGRTPAVETLIDLLNRAWRGQGQAVFVVGEQGIGKTRLVEEVLTHAALVGFKTLRGTAYAMEGRWLYGPIVEALHGGLDDDLIALARQRLSGMLPDLARLLPELGPSLAEHSTGPLSDEGRLDIIHLGDPERLRLFTAIAGLLALIAEAQPLVVFLDNLHAAGEASLQLLHYLVRNAAHHRLLLICAVDEARLVRGERITQFIGELQIQQLAHRLNLSEFTAPDVAEYCAYTLEVSLTHPGLAAIAEAVHRFTEGHPLFVRELLHSMQLTGVIERAGDNVRLLSHAALTVPRTIHEMLGVRLSHLSHEVYRALGVAAVIGPEFSPQLLEAVLEWPRAKVLDAVEEMLAGAYIEATEAGYRFHHEMARQVVYGDMSPPRRAWLHQKVAEAIQQSTPPAQLNARAASLAHHYERAGIIATAVEYLIRAGDWARRAHALRESVGLYTRAIALLRPPPTPETGSQLGQLLERRSQTNLGLSEFDAAIQDLEELVNLYHAEGQVRRAGEALYQIGFAHYWAHRLLKASMFLDQALDIAERLDHSALRSRVLHLHDILSSTQGSVENIAVLATPADPGEATPLQAAEYWGYAMLAHLRYDFAEAQRHAEVCVRVGESLSQPFLALGGYFILGMSQASLGHYQASVNSLQLALQLSQVAGERFWRARLLNTIGWVYSELYSLERAIEYDLASLELAQAGSLRLTEAEGNALANLATDYYLLGQYEAANDYLAHGLALTANEPFMRWRYATRMLVLKGYLSLVDGNVAEAQAAMDKALELARSTKSRKNIARSCLLRGYIHAHLGQTEAARAAMNHALAVVQRLKAPGLMWPCHVHLADLERGAGQIEASQAHYAAAAALIRPIADQLTDNGLRQSFLDAEPVQRVFTQLNEAHS
jgi:DNA-binding SARP family transcriptional activator/predicted negative regulator of RcsB-dependent stress response